MTIGGMVWRTGELLGLEEQIAWFAQNGFTGIGFHTGPCLTGAWAAFDVRTASQAQRHSLKEAVQGFDEVSLHGEFDLYDVCLCTPNELVRRASVETLSASLELAAEIGAPTVTTHMGQTRVPAPHSLVRAQFARSVAELAEMAARAGVTIAFELTGDYDLVCSAPGPVGITLDVGHVAADGGAGYRDFGSLGGLVRYLRRRIVHVHVHDYDGYRDHLPLGAGRLDFRKIVGALCEVGYTGMLCLELPPTPTTPADYLAAKAMLQDILAERAAPA